MINNFKKISKIILFSLLAIQLSFAGDPARYGTAGGMQTVVPVGARYLAMAGANVSTVEGIDGISWNPAGLSNMSGNAAGVFSTMNIFNDVAVNYMAIGANMGGFGNIGVSLKAFDFGDIPVTTVTDPDGAGGGTFSPTFFTLGLTYANRLTDVIQVGVTAKLISESIDRAGATAVAFDAGIQYANLGGFEGLSFGVVMRNIGSSLQYTGSGLNQRAVEVDGASFADFLNREAQIDNLPGSFEIGMSYAVSIDNENALTLFTNFNNYNYGSDDFRFGGEYIWNNMVALRGGYIYATDLAAEAQLYRFTLGGGFNYTLGDVKLNLDYSYRDSQYFDGNNLFSIKVSF